MVLLRARTFRVFSNAIPESRNLNVVQNVTLHVYTVWNRTNRSMVDFKSYKLDDVPEILVLELTGRLDTENSEHLMNCVQTHIEDGGSRIILNCEDLDFISSLGLGTLLRAMTRLKKLGGSMALAGPRGAVADVLRLVHLNRLLSIHANVDEAATAMKRQS